MTSVVTEVAVPVSVFTAGAVVINFCTLVTLKPSVSSKISECLYFSIV